MQRAQTIIGSTKHDEILIDVFESDSERDRIRSHDWTCVHCNGQVTPRLGPERRWHFAHKPPLDENCPLVLWAADDYNPETAQHIAMKAAAALEMQRLYPESLITFEAAVREAGRIADVLVQLESGQRIAIECQWSSMTLENLHLRSSAYESASIDVIWMFPDGVMHDRHRKVLREQRKAYLEARLEEIHA